MIRTRPVCDPDRRYNLKEAAAALEVSVTTIRRWEELGIIRFVRHKGSRDKITTGRQIVKCWEATYL